MRSRGRSYPSLSTLRTIHGEDSRARGRDKILRVVVSYVNKQKVTTFSWGKKNSMLLEIPLSVRLARLS